MLKRISKAVFVIIGTLIGAGFASGQEIYLFFYQYGINGMIGILVSSILLGIVICKVFSICKNKEIKNYREFLNLFIKNEKQLDIFNTIINIFILVTFYIMIAGFGAYLEQQFGLNSLIGSIILAIICFFVFLKNVSGLIKINQVLVPILIGSLCVIGIIAIDLKNILEVSNYVVQNSSWKWFLDGILYSSYNTILLIPILIALRNLIESEKENTIISIITTTLVIILSLIIFFMLAKVDVNIENLEMPAVYIVSKISRLVEYIYGFIILSSILTTSVSLGTSFLENVSKGKKSYKQIAIFICISSIMVSKIGFSNLVSLLYPIFGYIGLIQIIKIILLKNVKSKQVKLKN